MADLFNEATLANLQQLSTAESNQFESSKSPPARLTTGDAAVERVIRDELLRTGRTRDELEIDEWHNVGDTAQHLEIQVAPMGPAARGRDGRALPRAHEVARISIAPGATVRLPKGIRNAIQRVSCDQHGCLKGSCIRDDHDGTIIGGLAPTLIRTGSRARLDSSLIPQLERRADTSIAPADIAARLREAQGGAADPALARARARRGSVE